MSTENDAEQRGRTPQWNGPESASFEYHPITLLNDWPLPTGDEEVRALWKNNEQLQHEHDEPPHPDELNERYVNIIHEDINWKAFFIGIYGFGMEVYFWNRSGDYGFSISNLEDDTESLRRFIESWAEEDA